MDNQEDEDFNYQYDDENMMVDEYYESADYEQDYYYDSEPNAGNTFEILPQTLVFNQFKVLVEKTATMIAMPFGWALLLLRDFKWNYQYASTYFQNPLKYQAQIGYSQELQLPTQCTDTMEGQCLICCGEGKQISNICGESYCLTCWKGHIETGVNSMNPFLRCMGCETPLLYELIIKIISESQSKYEEKYKKLLCQNFSTTNTSYQCCFGTDCTNCIKCEDYNVTTVKCTCGKSFCFRCKNDDHSPCTCEEREKWLDMVIKEEADAKWMSLNTKICPWCNKAVERSAGCNFMSCICGKSFCYMCSKPWEPDHKDHFKCHIYKKKDDKNVDKQKAILEKMNFYAEKYLNANRNAVDLKKIDTFEKRKLLFEHLNVELTDSDFIDQAYKFAIECCDSLKWIYVFSYFVKFKQIEKKEAIDFTQGEYECYKEQLLKKLSIDLKRFLSKLERMKDYSQKIGDLQMEEFMKLKKNITNYYTCTKQFKEKFIEELSKIDPTEIRRESDGWGGKEEPKLQTKKSNRQKRK